MSIESIAADIRFFFTEIIKHDLYKRKDFWLSYISSIKDSRVAIGSADRYRLRNLLKEKEKDFAECKLKSTLTLDCGNHIAVEFSDGLMELN